MSCILRKTLATALMAVMAVSLAALPLGAADGPSQSSARNIAQSWSKPLSRREKAELLLSRITFGPRPGDVDRALQMGLSNFLNKQLHPAGLDDSALESRLQNISTLSMTAPELAADYPPPMQVKRREQRRLAALEKQGNANGRFMRMAANQDSTAAPDSASPGSGNASMTASAANNPNTEPAPAPAMQMNRPSAANANGDPAPSQKPREILLQLSQEEMLRAVYSQRQLQEVMVHFWMNHFNVYWPKGADRYYLTSFEQNVIRPHALGNFEDLLVATAESPAMLFYLDNWMSVSPQSAGAAQHPPARAAMFRPAGPFGPFGMRRFPARARAAQKNQKGKQKRGLNENYGRELMELHTIGLNYTQKDVTEVARCFTGWTLQRPGQGGGFTFNPRLHDYGKKVVLGYTIPAGQGIEDGFEVLHILAMDPHTAEHIAYELCQRFVADNPPPALVERASKTYLATQGDIAAVLKTILTSPEFYSQAAYQAKIKTPFEYVASALRALNADTDGGQALYGEMARMGEPMFMYEAPSGWDDVARTWVNSSALLARMNFALALSAGRIRGTQIDWTALAQQDSAEQPRAVVRQVAEQLTGAPLGAPAANAILEEMAKDDPSIWGAIQPGQETRLITALVIASPEFQRR